MGTHSRMVLLQQLARAGVVKRIGEINRELAELFSIAPEEFEGDTPPAIGKPALKPVKATATNGNGRRRHTLSKAQRAEIADRMKRYWASRRKTDGPRKKNGKAARAAAKDEPLPLESE